MSVSAALRAEGCSPSPEAYQEDRDYRPTGQTKHDTKSITLATFVYARVARKTNGESINDAGEY